VETISRQAGCLALLLGVASIGLAQTEPLGTRLGEQVQTTLTDPAYQQGGWDVFRLVPPPMSPSWSSGDFSAQLAAIAWAGYDDNILQDNSQRIEAMRFTLAPSLRLQWKPSTAPPGTGAELFYTPVLDWFVNHSQYDTVNHYGGADLAAFFGKSTLELHYRTALSSEPSMLQTSREQELTEAVVLDGTHELGNKTRLSSEFELGYGDIAGGSQYGDAGGRLLLEYHVRERLALGVGYGLRYMDVNPGLSMLFNEPQADFLWAYTDRFHISLRAGFQIGTVNDAPSAAVTIGPLVVGSLSYAVSEKTSLRLELSHQDWPSYYSAGQLNELTQATVAIHHTFSQRIFADLDGGPGYNNQINPLANTASAGSYSFWSVGCLVGYVFTAHVDCALTYRYSQRTANLDTAGFNRNVAGVRITYHF
jgi:hypothetical protein